MTDVNFWAVLVSAVASMVIGSIWFGPLFGKKWQEITSHTSASQEERAMMMKNVWRMYLLQFFLSLFQAYVLASYIVTMKIGGVHNALLICAAFVLPVVANGSMWNAENTKMSWARFYINASYNIVLFLVYGLILSYWR